MVCDYCHTDFSERSDWAVAHPEGYDLSGTVQKRLIAPLYGAGVILLSIGIFTGSYSLWVGFIRVISIGSVTGAVSTMIGSKSEGTRKRYQPSKKKFASAVNLIHRRT